MSEIIFHPEEWAAFTVVQAVEHGSRVKKGDVLVEFDSEKIDKAIADLKTEQQIAEVALKLSEDQLATLEKSTPMDLETSQRSQRHRGRGRQTLFRRHPAHGNKDRRHDG